MPSKLSQFYCILIALFSRVSPFAQILRRARPGPLWEGTNCEDPIVHVLKSKWCSHNGYGERQYNPLDLGGLLMTTSINEVNVMTESEKRYRIYERCWEMHSNGQWINGVWVPIQNFDFVLQDKWGMLANQGGSL